MAFLCSFHNGLLLNVNAIQPSDQARINATVSFKKQQKETLRQNVISERWLFYSREDRGGRRDRGERREYHRGGDRGGDYHRGGDREERGERSDRGERGERGERGYHRGDREERGGYRNGGGGGSSSSSFFTVKMGGIPYRATVDEIIDWFQPEARCASARILRNRDNRPSGEAIAEFDTEDEAR